MSFILDALKKSETDRQQQSNKEFAAVPVSPRAPSVPRWLWIVGFLLAINLAVLIGLLVQPDSPPPATRVEVATVAEPVKQEILPLPSFEEKVASARQNAPALQEVEAEAVPENSGTVRSVLISQDPSAVSEDKLYPTIQELRAKGAISIPELHLDIHVFSKEPEDRFVFINMSKLREGSQLAEGPVVAEITPDGVVLGHRGQFFILPRE
jgi:general secretion pathway protein B